MSNISARARKSQPDVNARLRKLADMVWETRWVSDDADYQKVVGIAAEIRSVNYATIDTVSLK